MKKIKIMLFSNAWDYGGTARSHERIAEALDRSKFDVYIFYGEHRPHSRLDKLKAILGEDHCIPFDNVKQTGFYEKAMEFNFDIIHFARSGYFEWPFDNRMAKLQIETNIFGFKDDSEFLDKSIAICQFIASVRGSTDAVIYNPIPEGSLSGENFRSDLNIPANAIVCGRIGRPDNFHPIAIESFKLLVERFPNAYYLVMAPCDKMLSYVKEHKVPNVIFMDPTTDDHVIDMFYKTIDIFLHYRNEGEVCSTAQQQSLMQMVPVISHLAHPYNGQVEIVGEGGFVAKDVVEYVSYAQSLIERPDLRKEIGAAGRRLALERYAQGKVVKTLEECYIKWAVEKGILPKRQNLKVVISIGEIYARGLIKKYCEVTGAKQFLNEALVKENFNVCVSISEDAANEIGLITSGSYDDD